MQLLEDFLALIAMQCTGAYDDLRLMSIRERFEARFGSDPSSWP